MDSPKQVELQLQSFQVKLKKSYVKIFYLLPAVDQTFVFVGMYAVGKDVLVHCDKQGKILFQHKFTKNVDSLGMVEKNQAIVLETQHNRITVFNLSNYEIVHVPFQFFYAEPQAQLMTFSESKYMCVVETGRYNDNRFKLTYFSGNLIAQSKPIAVYESDSSWTYEHAIRKGDEQSMIIWFKQRHDEQFEIKQFHLEGLNPNFNHFITPNLIGQSYGKEKLQVALQTIWSVSQHKFLLFCHTEKSNLGLENNQKNNNNNFIWDTSSNQIRQSKFYFGDSYNDFLIDSFSIGRYSVFHTFSFLNGKAEPSPVFYVDHKEERILANLERKWQCTYLTKFAFPGYETFMYVQSNFENSNVDKFGMKIIRLVQKAN